MTQTNGNVNQHTQKRLLHFEDCAQAIDQLFISALESKGDVAFDEFIDFASRFSKLSVYNAMLVRLQRPGAAAVGSRKEWQKIERHVLPDAIPIVILQPFGPVRFIFEYSDTDGKPMPAQDKNPLFAKGEINELTYEHTRQAAKNYFVEVVETDQYGNNLAGTAAGINVCPTVVTQNKNQAFRVKINAKHDLPSRYATLAHELGHIYCGHLGQDINGRWPDRRKNFHSPIAMELEAEAVAWLVCQRNGIVTRSKEYLKYLIDDAGLQTVSMYSIYEAANRVESRTIPKKK